MIWLKCTLLNSYAYLKTVIKLYWYHKIYQCVVIL